MEKLLFITDLDATLLWHDYSYEEAKPVISRLREYGFPLILNSSKTLAELIELAEELQSTAPIIAENGGAVAIHHDSGLPVPSSGHDYQNYTIVHAGLSRDFVLSQAHALRDEHKYKFEGFADWTPEQLSSITKLSTSGASLAMERHVTEPILWEDSEDAFEQFSQQLASHDIQIIRGGKFTHLMGKVNKADGALLASNLYRSAEPDTHWTIVALGDSENDLKMLEQSDIPVVIPHQGEIRIRPEHSKTIFAQNEASLGWAESVNSILESFSSN